MECLRPDCRRARSKLLDFCRGVRQNPIAFCEENRTVGSLIGGLIVVLIGAGGLEVVHGFERAFDDVPAGDDGSVLRDGAFHDAAGHERESHADEQDLTKERKMTGEHPLSCLLRRSGQIA